ncbi:MAG: hypothetical protein ABIF10_02015 [Candidatus Woesearchaeota archaeon]
MGINQLFADKRTNGFPHQRLREEENLQVVCVAPKKLTPLIMVGKKKLAHHSKQHWGKLVLVVAVAILALVLLAKVRTDKHDKTITGQATQFGDQEALTDAFSNLDIDWTGIEPIATSPKGDAKLDYMGADLKDLYYSNDKDKAYIKFTTYGYLNDQLAYELYIFGQENHQIRIIPNSRIYVWKHIGNKPAPATIAGLGIDSGPDYIEIELPAKMLKTNATISVQIFDIAGFNKNNGSQNLRDEVQFANIAIPKIS